MPKVRISRRRVISVLALLCVAGTIIAWKAAHRHDPRLVGQWKASPVPTFAMGIFAEWELLSDGTGERSGKLRPDHDTVLVPATTPVSQQQTTGVRAARRVTVVHLRGRFRWWTRGDRLFVQLSSSRTAWMQIRESAREVFRSITGQPVMRVINPVWEYQFVVEEGEVIRITPVSIPTSADNRPFELTRLEGGSP